MVAPVRDHRSQGDQIIAAYEAALVVAREMTLAAVLQCIADLAREVVPARYAALAVTYESGQIRHFFTSGIASEDQEQIGHLPRGLGLLGDLMHGRGSLLVSDIAADPRSVGFPPGHPPMKTLLGVPVRLGVRLLGNLYLSERCDGGPFNDDDVAAVQILATHAAAAIDRALAYQRVEEQRDQMRIILDRLPAGVLIVAAPDGVIETANVTMIEILHGANAPVGVLPVYGRDVQLLRADGTPPSHEERLGIRALQGEAITNEQLLLECGDGRRVSVLAQAAPLPDASGVIHKAVLVLQDVTRLRAAEQLKDDFLSLVSHEFRTPLTTIRGGAHLLANDDGALDEQTSRELLRDIADESTRLDHMLTNMLTLAEVMAGRLAACTEPLLIEPLVRSIVGAVMDRAPSHSFVIAIPPGLPPAEGDPALLTQVLRNLYENAVKYSPDGGQILTMAATDGRTVTLQLIDEGVGIAVDEVDHVFERFYRTGGVPAVRGTGLGLYLSRHLIEAQRGELAVTSAGLGRGASFSITLPIACGWSVMSDEELVLESEARRSDHGPQAADSGRRR